MPNPAWAQNSYAFYADGTETGSVIIGAANTAQWLNVTSDRNLQLRIRVQNTTANAGATTDDWQLQRSIAGGAFANVTTSSTGVKAFASASLTDAAVTTNRLGAGTGSFVAGEISETGLVTDRQVTASNYSELLYSLTLIAADLSAGQAITFRVQFNGAVLGAYNQTPTINVLKNVTADAGSYKLTGSAATFVYLAFAPDEAGWAAVPWAAGAWAGGKIDDPIAFTGYTLAADPGAYKLTGASTTQTLRGLKVTADPGVYKLTGASTTQTLHGWRPSALSGVYKLTGASTTQPLHGWRVTATDVGSYKLTGAATTQTLKGWRVTADAGSYKLTGFAATPVITHAFALVAGAGNYKLTGSDATFVKTNVYSLAANAGSYKLTGASTTQTLHGWKLAAAPGAYRLTGVDATPRRTIITSALAGSYKLTGASTTQTLHGWRVTAAAGAYRYVGSDATPAISAEKRILADPGSYRYSGTDAVLRFTRLLAADSGNYRYNGGDVSFNIGVSVPPVVEGPVVGTQGTGANFSRKKWREWLEAKRAQQALEAKANELVDGKRRTAMQEAAATAAQAIDSALTDADVIDTRAWDRMVAGLKAAEAASKLATVIRQSDMATRAAEAVLRDMDDDDDAAAMLLLGG